MRCKGLRNASNYVWCAEHCHSLFTLHKQFDITMLSQCAAFPHLPMRYPSLVHWRQCPGVTVFSPSPGPLSCTI